MRSALAHGMIRPQVHALSFPARSFTGDFYFYREGEEGFRFVLGDVSGKGLAAAVFMAMIQEEIDRVTDCEYDLISLVRCFLKRADAGSHRWLWAISPATVVSGS